MELEKGGRWEWMPRERGGRVSNRENRKNAVDFMVGWGGNDKFGFGHIAFEVLMGSLSGAIH